MPSPAKSPNPTPNPAAKPTSGSISVRLLAPRDPIPEITKLLHRAYAKQVAMGLQPLAGRQDDATTTKRVKNGECYVAVSAASTGRPKIVGTILFHEVEDAKGPPFFQNSHVDSFSQFAVDPDLQGFGIGQLLLDKAESRAIECGSTELGLSMAEPDQDLMKYYLKRGYRFVEHWQWPYTNYVSAILSKSLK